MDLKLWDLYTPVGLRDPSGFEVDFDKTDCYLVKKHFLERSHGINLGKCDVCIPWLLKLFNGLLVEHVPLELLRVKNNWSQSMFQDALGRPLSPLEDRTGLDGRPSQQESRLTQRRLEDGLKTEYIDVATFRQYMWNTCIRACVRYSWHKYESCSRHWDDQGLDTALLNSSLEKNE